MDYRFTAILIILLCLLAFCVKPVQPTSLKHKVKESIALPDGKSVGDAVTFTSNKKEYTGVYVKEDNEQLSMCKISDTADSKAVYGVFMRWDDADDGLDGCK